MNFETKKKNGNMLLRELEILKMMYVDTILSER